jgi:hypothetical protein
MIKDYKIEHLNIKQTVKTLEVVIGVEFPHRSHITVTVTSLALVKGHIGILNAYMTMAKPYGEH